MSENQIHLKVAQRKSLLTLTNQTEATIARDAYYRLWVKDQYGFWHCYGSMVQARGTEVKE